MPRRRHLARTVGPSKDEFYTLRENVEMELRHYSQHFAGKFVLCNCNDGEDSEFMNYFIDNFDELCLRKLVGVEFSQDNSFAYASVFEESGYGYRQRLSGNGDFRSPECVEFFKDADIVVTNPPFSLFKDFFLLLLEHDKKFLTLANSATFSLKYAWPYFYRGEVWLGGESGPMYFRVPDDYEGKVVYGENRALSLGIAWYTNLEHGITNGPLELTKEYSPELYPFYDNYPIINVDKVKDIPKDYYGKMGVPISYFYRHNPEQFKILGLGYEFLRPGEHHFRLGDRTLYTRMIIQRRHCE